MCTISKHLSSWQQAGTAQAGDPRNCMQVYPLELRLKTLQSQFELGNLALVLSRSCVPITCVSPCRRSSG